jgi:hypothetical protein
MLTKQQKTEEAEGERQKQVAITGESAKGRRRLKKEERETDSAEIRKRGQQKEQGHAPQMSSHLKRRRSERDWRGIVARGGGEGRWRLKGEGGRIEGQGVEGGGWQGMRTRSSRRC